MPDVYAARGECHLTMRRTTGQVVGGAIAGAEGIGAITVHASSLVVGVPVRVSTGHKSSAATRADSAARSRRRGPSR